MSSILRLHFAHRHAFTIMFLAFQATGAGSEEHITSHKTLRPSNPITGCTFPGLQPAGHVHSPPVTHPVNAWSPTSTIPTAASASTAASAFSAHVCSRPSLSQGISSTLDKTHTPNQPDRLRHPPSRLCQQKTPRGVCHIMLAKRRKRKWETNALKEKLSVFV